MLTAIVYLLAGLGFAEMSRVGGGGAKMWIVTLVAWPVTVGLFLIFGGKKNDKL